MSQFPYDRMTCNILLKDSASPSQIQKAKEIEGVAGVHIMAIEWEAAIEGIVKGAGLLPRPVL